MDKGIQKLTHEEIVIRQIDRMKSKRLPFCVVLNNIRSLYNVGAIFRTADGVGVEKIWLTGITGYPPQAGISKTALGAEQSVAWEYRADCIPLLSQLKSEGYQLVLLEQTQGAIRHDAFIPQRPMCLVLGNEVEGIGNAVVTMCDEAVEIDMVGIKNSLNVAVAFGVLAYHIRSKMNQHQSL